MSYVPLRMSGTCRNGAERDSGKLWHAVRAEDVRPFGQNWARALCGSTPGRKGNGWGDPYAEAKVTCPRCLKKLGVAPRTCGSSEVRGTP